MARVLVFMHGRDIKPRGTALAALASRAILRGLERAGEHGAAAAVRSGNVRLLPVYYGDISNEIEADANPATERMLTAENDPEYRYRPCFPIEELEDAFALTDAIPRFSPAAYRRVLDEAEDRRFLDEAFDIASLFGSLLTFGTLNRIAVAETGADIAAYLTSKVVGSAIRQRLREVLEPLLLAGDDVCLVTHSLGCIVAYDVFWKYSFDSEHAKVRAAQNPVRLWITIGCPLGEPGVRLNLLDAAALEGEKFPRKQFRDWTNINAYDDFVAHVESMARPFATMRRRGFCETIRDERIENCWQYRDRRERREGRLVSNPHDFYGYLMHQKTGRAIARWIEPKGP